jgi:toxin ParE1/3/4
VTSGRRRWAVRLAETAERDFEHILRWTADQFGQRQAETYLHTLLAAIEALTDGPYAVGVRPRPDIGRALLSLHVHRGRRRGRHVIYFCADENMRTIDVLRVLHDAMDPGKHFIGD